jgi:hypothetical protein
MGATKDHIQDFPTGQHTEVIVQLSQITINRSFCLGQSHPYHFNQEKRKLTILPLRSNLRVALVSLHFPNYSTPLSVLVSSFPLPTSICKTGIYGTAMKWTPAYSQWFYWQSYPRSYLWYCKVKLSCYMPWRHLGGGGRKQVRLLFILELLVLDWGEWSASHPSFAPRERAPGTIR